MRHALVKAQQSKTASDITLSKLCRGRPVVHHNIYILQPFLKKRGQLFDGFHDKVVKFLPPLLGTQLRIAASI
jgi:hypothetical protein